MGGRARVVMAIAHDDIIVVMVGVFGVIRVIRVIGVIVMMRRARMLIVRRGGVVLVVRRVRMIVVPRRVLRLEHRGRGDGDERAGSECQQVVAHVFRFS